MKFEQGNRIWFTSDTHFGHTNIAGPSISSWKSGYRNFDSVHEMNKALSDGVNKYVETDDILYFLGDLGFGGHENIPAYRHSIQCHNFHVIRGNHDKHLDSYKHLFSSLQDYLTIKAGGYDIVMFHYAMRVWLGSHKGSLLLYGHSHNSLEGTQWGRSMDVGVDNAYRLFGEYRPFSLEWLIETLTKRDPKFVDHHNKDTNVR